MMKWLWDKINNMNGWKAVIAVVLSVGTSYLGLHDQQITNATKLDDYIQAQKETDRRQDHALEVMTSTIHQDIQHLGDKIDNGTRPSRTK